MNDLEYWIEPGIQNEHGMNDDSTHFWVKIPFIPAFSSLNFYILYGNPSATARSNISTTFLFGDDFNDNSVDTSKWNKYIYGIGQIIEQNNRLEHNSPKSNPESGTELFSKQSFTGPVVVDIQFKKGGHVYRGTGLRVENNLNTYSAWMGWQDWGGFGPSVTINSVIQNVVFRNDSWSRYNNPEYYLRIFRKPDSTFRFIANVPYFEQDGYKYWEHTFSTAKMPLDQPLKVGTYEWVWKYAGTILIRYEDNIRVRKYTEPEPFCILLDEYPVSSPANITFDTICEGDSLMWRGLYYSGSGMYYDSLLTFTGCDSIIQLSLSVLPPQIFYFDYDGDGYGAGAPFYSCTQPLHASTNNTDCDDTDFSRHEGIVIYLDSDNDSYHVAPEITICMGDQIPSGYKLYTLGIDCNDQNPNVNPGATEICNGLDDDCDGAVDENLLGPACAKQAGVCAGSRKSICGGAAGWLECDNVVYEAYNPNYEISETSCDGLDNDCDMYKDEGFSNNDGDGMADCVDPDDDNDGILDTFDNCPMNPNPNQLDTDQDLQGDVCDADDDNDGYNDIQDCAPLNFFINPGAQEICGNGIDDNCNGQTDECYTLMVSKQGNGNGNVSTSPAGINCGSTCSFTFPAGTIVTVQATPDAISDFSGWSGACAGIGVCQITMDNNKQISALFTKKYFNVSITKTGSGNGTVTSSPAGISCGSTCSANYEAGMIITLTAEAQYGSAQFTGWGGDAASCGTSQNCQLAVYSNMNITASFECLIPDAAGTITGPANVIPDGSTHIYSVPQITNATTYSWTLPPGCSGNSTTNSIEVTFAPGFTSGVISVLGSNSCGSGLGSGITVYSNTPEVFITASSNPFCYDSPVVFTASTQNGGNNPGYLWFVNDTLRSSNIIDKNRLVLHCPYDGNANDISIQGLNGTVYNATPTIDRFGNPNSAFYFNGYNAYIDYGDQDTLNPHYSDISISAWVKVANPGQHARIYSKGTHGGSQPGYDLMFYSPGHAATIFCEGSHEDIVRSNSIIQDTSWHHFVSVMDRNGYLNLYIDGIKQNDSIDISQHSGYDMGYGTLNAAVGASYSWNGWAWVNEYFNGSIDEVMIYKRVLSSDEILNLYNHIGTSGIEFSYVPKPNDEVKCVLISDFGNNFYTTDTSNVIQMQMIPPPVISPSGPIVLQGNDSVQLIVSTTYLNPFYQWKRNGVLIGGATDNTYTASEDGWYSCTVNGTDCIFTDSVHVLKPFAEIKTNDSIICIGQNSVLHMIVKSSESGTLCTMVNENDWVQMTAPNNCIFTNVYFASYGTPEGDCGNFSLGWCHAMSSMNVAQNACIGNNNFTLAADNYTFGDPCGGTYKRFYMEAEYSDIYDLQMNYLWSTGDSTASISTAPQFSQWIYCTVSILGYNFTDSIFIEVISEAPYNADSPAGPQYINPGQTQVTYTVAPINNATAYRWLLDWGITSSGISGEVITSSNSITVDFDPSFSAGSIYVSGLNACGMGMYNQISILAIQQTKTLQLKLFLEGLYNAQNQMNEVYAYGWQPYWGQGIADNITLELYKANDISNPSIIKFPVLLYTNGFTEYIPLVGLEPLEYYIVVKHRNSIETWSSIPVTFSGADTLFYDFSDSAVKAYDNNMKPVAGGNFAIWSGDVNQDGVVDATDISKIDNGITIILNGYNPEDINGDGRVDASDMSFVDNNSQAPPKKLKRP